MTSIIQQLKIARRKRHLRQRELGSKLGLPQSHVSNIEQGETDPRLSTVSDLARLLDHELMLIPRNMISAVKALISNQPDNEPTWKPDEEATEESENE